MIFKSSNANKNNLKTYFQRDEMTGFFYIFTALINTVLSQNSPKEWKTRNPWSPVQLSDSFLQKTEKSRVFQPMQRFESMLQNKLPLVLNNFWLALNIICVNSFSSIPYCSNSEYWTQKRIQSESIHSIILDVHVLNNEFINTTLIIKMCWSS